VVRAALRSGHAPVRDRQARAGKADVHAGRVACVRRRVRGGRRRTLWSRLRHALHLKGCSAKVPPGLHATRVEGDAAATRPPYPATEKRIALEAVRPDVSAIDNVTR